MSCVLATSWLSAGLIHLLHRVYLARALGLLILNLRDFYPRGRAYGSSISSLHARHTTSGYPKARSWGWRGVGSRSK